MSRNHTAIHAQRAVDVSFALSLVRSARCSSRKRYTAGVCIALTYTAMILQRISPMVWTTMPDLAVVIVCLASVCSALAGQIA